MKASRIFKEELFLVECEECNKAVSLVIPVMTVNRNIRLVCKECAVKLEKEGTSQIRCIVEPVNCERPAVKQCSVCGSYVCEEHSKDENGEPICMSCLTNINKAI